MSAFNEIPLSVKKDFVARISNAPTLTALAELIWNGLDAVSDVVEVNCVTNGLGGIDEIRVKDYGFGISHSRLNELFGNLGSSWKKEKKRFLGRAQHGKNGQGRLTAFSLGNHVVWHTVYEQDGDLYSYQISGLGNDLERLNATSPVKLKTGQVGTEVVITAISKSHGALCSDQAWHEIAKIFAAYLSQYPGVTLKLNNIEIDPSKLQVSTKEFILDDVETVAGEIVKSKLEVIEWSVDTKRKIHLCDQDGVSLFELDTAAIKAPGFNFTAYIKSDYFRELDKKNDLILGESHLDIQKVLNQSKDLISNHFRAKAATKQSQIVKRWKQEKIYPYPEKPNFTQVEQAEQQMFDILAVNVESYLPKFSKADQQSRKFIFKLLAQALKDNPSSVQKIITEILNLKKEQQDELADLMEKTPLSNIISSAKIVANRLDFLVGLKNLLFDKETKNIFLERDQLHKILENEAWIFDEGFSLSGSEKTLEDVLQIHLGKLRTRLDDPVLREDGKQGRVDLMLSRSVQPRYDEHDHLVVELKRASQKINTEVLNQVESYAIAVAQDSRFLTEKTKWRFMVVANEFDDHARRKARQKDQPKGLVFDDAELNIQVWAYEWAEVLANAEARLQFINKSLNYQADRESAKQYLQKAHAKFIPEVPEAE